MGHQYQRKTDAASQKRRPKIAPGDEWQNAGSHVHAGQSSNTLLHLQRTIGNQAVQRLIMQRSPADAVPVDSSKDKEKTRELPPFVAHIIGEHSNFETKSTLPGHEGKIEIVSMHMKPGYKSMEVQFVKEADESSTAFQEAMIKGERIKAGEFMMLRRNRSGNIETVQTFEFTNGYISSLSISTSGGKTMEAITIEFRVDEKEKDEM